MTDPVVKISARGGVLDVVINRPAKHNAIDLSVASLLFDAVRRFGDDDDLRVMLIRSEGRYFSAGADLTSQMFPADDILSRPSAFRRWYRGGVGSLHPLLNAIEAMEKPVVVAHQGPCLGGALEMSLSCDFRLASSAATYALPETSLGALPGSGGLSRMTRLVGAAWAKWLIMANLPIDAAKAEQIGLIHAVYSEDEFAARVEAFCAHLAAQPPEVMATAKLAIGLVADLGPEQARDVERLSNSLLVGGSEFSAMMQAMRTRLTRARPSEAGGDQ